MSPRPSLSLCGFYPLALHLLIIGIGDVLVPVFFEDLIDQFWLINLHSETARLARNLYRPPYTVDPVFMVALVLSFICASLLAQGAPLLPSNLRCGGLLSWR